MILFAITACAVAVIVVAIIAFLCVLSKQDDVTAAQGNIKISPTGLTLGVTFKKHQKRQQQLSAPKEKNTGDKPTTT